MLYVEPSREISIGGNTFGPPELKKKSFNKPPEGLEPKNSEKTCWILSRCYFIYINIYINNMQWSLQYLKTSIFYSFFICDINSSIFIEK